MGKVTVSIIKKLEGAVIVKCGSCGGSGRRHGNKCSVCDGKGKVKLKGSPPVFKCGSCGGNGRRHGNKCSVCKGVGKVTSNKLESY